jgi:hypothetical protein
MHVGRNSETVINAARSNGIGKQSQREFEKKKPKHAATLIRKLLPFYLAYIQQYTPHIAILFVNKYLFW